MEFRYQIFQCMSTRRAKHRSISFIGRHCLPSQVWILDLRESVAFFQCTFCLYYAQRIKSFEFEEPIVTYQHHRSNFLYPSNIHCREGITHFSLGKQMLFFMWIAVFRRFTDPPLFVRLITSAVIEIELIGSNVTQLRDHLRRSILHKRFVSAPLNALKCPLSITIESISLKIEHSFQRSASTFVDSL